MAKPVITPNCSSLHIRSNAESLLNRTSKRVFCSQVNQMMAKYPRYDVRSARSLAK